MSQETSEYRLQLPERLQSRFEGLRARLRNIESTLAIAIPVFTVAVVFLVFFALERVFEASTSLRFALFFGTTFLLWNTAYQWLTRWVWSPRDLLILAKKTQKRHRKLGDRLVGVVELADPEKRPENFSAELYAAAIDQVATDAEKYDFQEAASWENARRWTFAATLFTVVVIGVQLLYPVASKNAWARLLQPIFDIPRYTLVQLEGIEPEKVVANGEAHTVAGRAEFRGRWRPSSVRVSIEGQSSFRSSVDSENGSFTIPLEPATQDYTLRIAAGDDSQEVEIRPLTRPALTEMQAEVRYPEYLSYPDTTLSVRSGSITALQGSQARFLGTINRPAARASQQLDSAGWVPLSISGADFSSDWVPLDTVFQVAFQWTDQYGLDASAPWPLVVKTEIDRAPTIALKNLPDRAAILITDVVSLELIGRDDYGVQELGLELERLNQGEEEAPLESALPSVVFRAQTPQETELAKTTSFSPQLFGLQENESVVVRAFVSDFLPNRERVYSKAFTVTVIGVEAHAEALRQGLEALMARVEEITRNQQDIEALNRDLLQGDLEDLDEDAALAEMRRLESLQAQNARDLQEMSRRGAELLSEALRNPSLDENAIQEWAENLSQMRSLAQNEMRQAQSEAQSARAAASESANAQAQENLENALEIEQDILDQLAELQENINQDLDDLQALTLAQRLRGLSGEEAAIVSDLQRVALRTIGMKPEELSAKYTAENQRIGTTHESVQTKATELGEEINRFAERTKIERYTEVSEAIKESELPSALAAIRQRILDNVSVRAMTETDAWASRFTEWADILEPEEEGGQGGQGGEGGQSGDNGEGDNSMEQLIRLLRTRESEVDLQIKTRSLTETEFSEEHIRTTTRDLADEQLTLSSDVDDITLENRVAVLHPILRQIGDLMRQVATDLGSALVGEQTDTRQTETVDNLTDAINILNESINEQSRQQSQSQSQATQEQMAFLMQMMTESAQASATPGNQGNPSPQDFSGENTANLVGDAAGSEGERRGVEQSTGAIQSFPTEFRDALQQYFDAIEDAY